MITVKRLKELIAQLPDDAKCVAYEGENIGISITLPDGRFSFIVARPEDDEDEQRDFSVETPE